MNWAALIPNRLNVSRSCVPLRYGKGVGRSGPCNPGGVSPSLHNDFPCITGSIFTGPGHPHQREMQNGFLEPISRWWGVPASSGPIQSLDKTKAYLSAPFPVFSPRLICRGGPCVRPSVHAYRPTGGHRGAKPPKVRPYESEDLLPLQFERCTQLMEQVP